MRVRAMTGLIVAASLFALPAVAVSEPAASEGARYSFEIPSTNGGVVRVSQDDAAEATVVCFLGAECPLARLYAPRLETLAQQFAPRGVRFVGVDSNLQDSMDDLRGYVSQLHLTFPVGRDYQNKVADQFGARRTPEVILLDREGTIRYRGRIDDQYEPGLNRPEPTRYDLRQALEELLAGNPISVPRTEAVGCLIGRVRHGDVSCKVTYCGEVSRILKTHCVECHRQGEIGPFALTDYDEVIGWGETMMEVIDDGRMPPWHANPQYGEFANARIMPKSDKETLRAWVAGGMPFGDVDQLPEPLAASDGWKLSRPPDLVLPMRDKPFTVPAEGIVEYQYFVVDPGFTEDKWLTGSQVIPGNRSVVHHCIVFVRPPDGSEFRGFGWLTAYVPGQRSTMMPIGSARKVPAGSRLVFQMHYTPNGTVQEDLTKVGILFASEEEVTDEVFTLISLNQEFEIPPHAADFEVTGGLSHLPEGSKLLAAAPHMHLRGKGFRLWAREGDERTVLLDVPHYDFNWQHVYEFARPIPLDKVERLEFIARFDNSAANQVNPDPSRFVTWGDQTWEEMAIAFFEVSRPREWTAQEKSKDQESAETSAERTREIERFVAKFFKRFDADGDDVILDSEMPASVQRFGFWQLDSDGDGRLTRSEIHEATLREKRF